MTAHYELIIPKQEVFRAYDIRGIVPEQLNTNAYYTIGCAFAVAMKAKNCKHMVLGRDGRITSPELAAAIRQGLLDSGIDVTDIGTVPSPVLYFATHHTNIDCGIIVTGSHNPSDYNGIKMVLAGKTLVKEDIENLYQIIIQGEYLKGDGQLQRLNIENDYIERISSDMKLERKLKVVIDCGNGVAGPLAIKLFESIGCDVVPLFCDIDGRFPNHHPDPSVEKNLTDLKLAVAKHQADIGLAFDGDADRIGVVTDQGDSVWPDRIMIMYARSILARKPGANIVFDVKCSANLAHEIEKAGGNPMMCPTGHSIVKGLMKQCGAELAGEMSGHIFFKERWYGFDDGLYSGCRLLEILSESDKPVSQQFADVPDSINTPEIKIGIDDAVKFDFMQQFAAGANFGDEAHLVTIDGVRVEFNNGWGLIRASNTTPCLVARFEADSEENLAKLQAMFKQQLVNINPNLDIPF